MTPAWCPSTDDERWQPVDSDAEGYLTDDGNFKVRGKAPGQVCTEWISADASDIVSVEEIR